MYITDSTFSQGHNLNRASRPSAGTDELNGHGRTGFSRR